MEILSIRRIFPLCSSNSSTYSGSPSPFPNCAYISSFNFPSSSATAFPSALLLNAQIKNSSTNTAFPSKPFPSHLHFNLNLNRNLNFIHIPIPSFPPYVRYRIPDRFPSPCIGLLTVPKYSIPSPCIRIASELHQNCITLASYCHLSARCIANGI